MQVSFNSDLWNSIGCPRHVSYRLEELGLKWTNQVLNLRVFDLLNMNQMDNNTAEELLSGLYRLLNPNTALDEELYYGFGIQPFSYALWRKEHKSYANVTVKEIVMEKEMNQKALSHLFRLTSRAFYKSDEYNSREYRYYSLWDLRASQKSMESTCYDKTGS